MRGLAINITSFAYLLKKVDFDAIVDHLALVHILKSKTEPATPRIKRLLDVLSAYSFNLYYMKGNGSNMIPNQRERNKSARSTWIKERYRSKLKTRMASKKISETSRKF